MELGLRQCSLRTDYKHTFKLLSTGEDREVPYIFLLSSPHTQKKHTTKKNIPQTKQPPPPHFPFENYPIENYIYCTTQYK